MRVLGLLAGLVGLGAACAAPGGSGASDCSGADPARGEALLATIRSLEGEWEATHEGETVVTRFEPSSHGSAVREILHAGGPEEMTSVYHLDGEALLVTHYCATGNQPRLRATRRDGDRIAFTLESVTNRSSPDQLVMGALELELVDPDHLVQRWRASGADADRHAMEFRFTRRPESQP